VIGVRVELLPERRLVPRRVPEEVEDRVEQAA
jgi:hypothetical protein